MKKLLLVRHAKSDWEDLSLSDFDRPLNSRGNKAAPEMAKRLVKRGIIPEHLVSSPALRAFSTAKYFAEAFDIKKKDIQLEAKIYEAPVSTLLEVVNGLDNQYNFIALFGHNPGITMLSTILSDSDIYNLPTCGMVLIEFPFDDWKMISAGTGDLKMYDYPKNPESL